jgi:multidrug efflux system membrane fusion protein
VAEFEDKPDGQHIGPERQLSPPPHKSGSAWILWVTLLVIVAVVAFYILHSRSAAKSAASKSAGGAAGGRRGMTGPVPVTVATASKGNIGVYQDAIGTVTPVYTATITAQASGVITQVNYREGQFVHKGDSLIEIDPRPYQATLLQAQGTLERDTNILAQAQMDVERYRDAWARNSINKQLLDDQEKIVLQDQGTVKNDQGTVDYDQVQLAYCHITAPISGQVGLRLVDPGNVVQAGSTDALVVITQMQPTTVIFTLAEDSLGQVETRLRKMHTLPVEAWDRNSTNKLATGKLLTINNQIDTTTGTVKLRATFDNKNSALFPNQFVNTRLLVNTPGRGHADSHRGRSTQWPGCVRLCDCERRGQGAKRQDGRFRCGRDCGVGNQPRRSSGHQQLSRSCRTEARSSCRSSPSLPTHRRKILRESIRAFHPASRCNLAADGRNPAGGYRSVLPAAGFCPAGGRLSHHPGGDVLSRRQS